MFLSVAAMFTEYYWQGSDRAVTTEEGMEVAKKHKSLFLECSARTRENVDRCFKELSSKVTLLIVIVELNVDSAPKYGHCTAYTGWFEKLGKRGVFKTIEGEGVSFLCHFVEWVPLAINYYYYY